MTTVTLTSDLGNGSFDLAAIKGTILNEFEHQVNIIDIAHTIKAFNIVEAAFILANSYPFYPKGTIHIISINPFYSSKSELLVLKYEEQFFIAPNNGLIPLLFEQSGIRNAYSLGNFDSTKEYFHLLSETAKKISQDIELDDIGKQTEDINRRISLRPVISKDTIRGTIIYIDSFGNLISNISKAQFDKVGLGRSFEVYFRHKDPITEIKQHYNQVIVGEELCLFNLSENLEIAVNMGNANELLGLNLDDIIQIDFFD